MWSRDARDTASSSASPSSLPLELENYPILVHSHLRWDWVWQRPQQFLTRLSRKHPVLFVEEPAGVDDITEPRAVIKEAEGYPNITIVRTEFPHSHFENRALLDAGQKKLVQGIMASRLGQKFANPVQWFYDPMAGTVFGGKMGERAIVYDCMDQLSQFRGTPPELVRREHELLLMADVVFAGGPKIHSAKVPVNSNCHCYGCGVDVKHFGKARLAETEIPEDAANLKGPILGFFGVVDERMDYDLVAKLADAHPEWTLMIIGPNIKIDPAIRPMRDNIHWLGGRDYQQLPGYVKAMDVCLLPFALNEATEFINPTKVLEYMATERPIVSRAIEDVVLQFSDIVETAVTHEEFIAACERAVNNPDRERAAAGYQRAQLNSWESIVNRLEGHIADVLTSQQISDECAA